MNEIVTEAIVLDKEDLREFDNRIFLYTKDLGRVTAKATSSRKIVSKLASHLEPLSYINVRLIGKRDNISEGRGFQVADALIIKKQELNDEELRNALRVAHFISKAVPDGSIDNELWDFLQNICIKGKSCSIRGVLGFLGFRSDFAVCELCSYSKPNYFYPRNNMFVCDNCIVNSETLKTELFKI